MGRGPFFDQNISEVPLRMEGGPQDSATGNPVNLFDDLQPHQRFRIIRVECPRRDLLSTLIPTPVERECSVYYGKECYAPEEDMILEVSEQNTHVLNSDSTQPFEYRTITVDLIDPETMEIDGSVMPTFEIREDGLLLNRESFSVRGQILEIVRA